MDSKWLVMDSYSIKAICDNLPRAKAWKQWFGKSNYIIVQLKR